MRRRCTDRSWTGSIRPSTTTSAVREDGATYRVVFNVADAEPGDGRVSSDLALVARFVNLLALSEMEPSDAELLAVVHESVTATALSDGPTASAMGPTIPTRRSSSIS